MDPIKIRARLGEISAKLESFEGVEQFSAEQLAEIKALNTEFKELEEQLSAAEVIESVKAKASTSVRKTTPAAPAAAEPRIEITRDVNSRFGGFKSSGEFFMAVKKFGQSGTVAPQFQNIMYEKNAEDGGFLVPEETTTAILEKLRQDPESFWGKATVSPISGNSMRMPTDESQPWTGGIQAYWTAEGAQIQESKPKFGETSLRLHKLAALVKPTDELLEDVPALESYINRFAPVAIMWRANSAIYNGDGVGKPMGFLNSPFTVVVSKESGQAADTIVARNVINMYAHMIPSALAGAAWYVNPAALPQLMTMKDDNGNFIYLNPGTTMNQSPFATLLGRPVIPMMSVINQLGDKGDIVFANLSYYYGIEKAGGVKQATSIHLNFDRDITAFRFTLRLDGKVPFSAPITTEKGSFQMSAFVVLEDR